MTMDTEAASAKKELESSMAILRGAIALAESRQPVLAEAITGARTTLGNAGASAGSAGDADAIKKQQEQSTTALKAANELIGVVSTATGVGQALDEWKECRSTIDRCDKLLVDLRKTGFGFVTAIVGAATFLFAQKQDAGQLEGPLLDAKIAILGMLVLLIVVLYWVDLAHQTWLGVAVARARKLERHPLGFRLSNDISDGFAAAQATVLGGVIYLMLLVAACAIFWFAIPEHATAQRKMIETALAVGIFAMSIGHLLSSRISRRGKILLAVILAAVLGYVIYFIRK